MIQYFRKLFNSFHKDHLDKPIAINLTIDTTSPMPRLIAKPTKPLKQKQGWPVNDYTLKCISEGEMTRKISNAVWFSIELEADKWSEIYYSDTRSVEELVLSV